MAVRFGCDTASPTYGASQTQGYEETAEIADARNATGAVTDQKAYSKTVKANATVVLSGTAPTAGTSGAVCGLTGLIESVKVTEVNTGYVQCEVGNTKSDSATQVAIT
jgi:hypothetical protein